MIFRCVAFAALAAGLLPAQDQPTISTRVTNVLVPTLVKTKKGDVVLTLHASDFTVADNGVPQKLILDPDTDSQPLALAICVETGGGGARHLEDYQHLDGIIDALVGDVEHKIAIVGFDSKPSLVLPFTSDTSAVSVKLAGLKKGNSGAAILDGVAYAVEQLRQQPPRYRRALVLISETVDRGSSISLGEALRRISDTNTAMYSFAFSSTKADLAHEATKFGYGPTEPGPPHGCFSKEGADAEYDGHYSKQVLDCLSQLAPPLRLITMAFVTARNALRTNSAAAVSHLTGGESAKFAGAVDLKAALVNITHDIHNHYILSFTPSDPSPGLHALKTETRGHPDLEVTSRPVYWIEEAN